MNKKGFTLVEILAVIVLLAIVITLVATKGFGALDNAKTAISKENEKTIIEGAKMLLVEIENCEILNDSTLEQYLENKGTSCKEINICNNNEIKNIINTQGCSEALLESYGYTDIECSEIDCNFDCFDVSLEYLKTNNYVSGKGIDDITDTLDNYNINICLNGSVTLQ